MKEDIVTAFLKKGKLLSPDALQFLDDKDVTELLQKNYPGIIITQKDFPPPPAAASGSESIRIIKNITSLPKELSTEDFISFYRNKYQKMQSIIVDRVKKDFVSLNKVDNSRNEVHVIGIVREIKEQDEKFLIELEDLTGTASVIFDEIGDLEQDDTVAVRGVAAGKVIYGKQIIYPDIPLRAPAKGEGRACFISDMHLEEAPYSDFEKFMKWLEQQNINYLFVAGDIGDKDLFEKAVDNYCYNKTVFVIPGEKESTAYPATPVSYRNRNIISLSNPAVIEVNGIVVLMAHKYSLAMLKKRHLGKPLSPAKQDELVLDTVPDVIHCGHTHQPFTGNYKSTTTVNSGSLLTRFLPVVVDFSTRDAHHINLQE